MTFLPGNAEYRHEVDCLLYFALREQEEPFGLPGISSYEAALMLLKSDPQAGVLERIAISNGHTVGWSFTFPDGKRQMQLHPKYRRNI